MTWREHALFRMALGTATGLESAVINQRQRFFAWAVASITAIWLLAVGGHWYFESLKVTSEKVRAYAESVDFARLNGAARAKALQDLAAKINALSYEERQRLRAGRLVNGWLDAMTDAEKELFIEATMPTGFKQMIGAFEQLPGDKRRKAIDDAMKNLRAAGSQPTPGGTNDQPPISPELEAKIRTIGLNTFYSQSSAQTKAELAPLLEELQRQMESGKLMRRQ